jgi:hypothetical protein
MITAESHRDTVFLIYVSIPHLISNLGGNSVSSDTVDPPERIPAVNPVPQMKDLDITASESYYLTVKYRFTRFCPGHKDSQTQLEIRMNEDLQEGKDGGK